MTCTCIGAHVWDDREGRDVWRVVVADPDCAEWRHRIGEVAA